MKTYDKLEQISYSKPFHGILELYYYFKKSNGISELFLLPLKRIDKLEQLCCSKRLWLLELLCYLWTY